MYIRLVGRRWLIGAAGSVRIAVDPRVGGSPHSPAKQTRDTATGDRGYRVDRMYNSLGRTNWQRGGDGAQGWSRILLFGVGTTFRGAQGNPNPKPKSQQILCTIFKGRNSQTKKNCFIQYLNSDQKSPSGLAGLIDHRGAPSA